MKKKILSFIVASALAVGGFVGILAPSVYAECHPVSAQDGINCIDDGSHEGDLWATLQNVINLILAIVGIIAVVMIIVGGITYATSAGDSGKVKKAKDTILYGIVGLVVALLAFAIVDFALANVFSGGSYKGGEEESLIIEAEIA